MKPRSQILEIQNQDRARGIEKKKKQKLKKNTICKTKWLIFLA